jgi:type IV pilus secretin PilQ/predicted competence protein
VTRGAALFLTIALAATTGDVFYAAGAGTVVPEARLTAITSRVSAKSTSLVIEASEPVPYVTTRPDPLTIVLDFRNVASDRLAKIAPPVDKTAITAVAVEDAQSMGAKVSRVRISLAEPLVHHVRAERNTVVIDFDRSSSKGGPVVMPPASRQADTGARIEVPAVDPLAALGLSAAGARPAAARQTASPGLSSFQQAPTAAAQDQPAMQRGRTYSGNPVSLDFQQADLRAVLRVFSEVSGLNMIIDPKVQGTVDVSLRDVPWDQALDHVLRANGLDWRIDGTIVRIAPREVFTAEDKSLAEATEAADARSAAQNLTTITRQLSYAKGDELVKLLKDTRAITKFGQAQFDPRTNILIIADLPGQLDQVRALIDTLDTAQPQVEIEARIVQTNKNFARQLGVQWGFTGRVDPALGNTTNLAFPNNGALNGRLGAAPGSTQPSAVNLGVGAATSAVGLALGSVNGAFNLDVALSALESSGNGRILSTPRVSTLNNVEAEMTQGVQIPLQTISNNTVTVTFKDAALTLKVTPQITAAGTVIMKVSLENATPDFSRAAGPAAIPPINTQRALTTLLVNDGQTSVIGGIYTSDQNTTQDRTPGLGQIPLLNWLFKRDQVRDASSELLIFITPRIIKS